MGDYKISRKDIILIKKIKKLKYLKDQHPPDEVLLNELIEMYKEELMRRYNYHKL